MYPHLHVPMHVEFIYVLISRDQLTVANLLIAIGAQRPSLAASTSSPSSYGNPALWTPSSTHRLPVP